MNDGMNIRMAKPGDREGIRGVHLDAFGEDERELVANLAVRLLEEPSGPRTINLVAESGGSLVGHVAFSPVRLKAGGEFSGYLMAPLAIKRGCQRKGIGSMLVEAGLELLRQDGVAIVFVYGDPGYYGRFGFTADAAKRYMPCYDLQYPSGWQALALGSAAGSGPSGSIGCVDALCDPGLW